MNTPKSSTARAPEILTATVVAQNEALTVYLEALFAENPPSLPAVVVAPLPVIPRVIDVPVTRVEVPVVVPVVAPPIVVAPAPVAPPVIKVAAPVQAPVTAPPVTATAPATIAATDLPRPEWASEPFQCLLLRLEGLTLALPLVKLNRILPWTEPTLIPGYASWLLGMLPPDDRQRKVKVVDTAGFIAPERKPVDAKTPQHIVTIGNGEWALTCDDVSSIITINPDKVRWRTSRTKRPWLAGTVIEHLCALVDAEQLDQLLSAGTADLPS